MNKVPRIRGDNNCCGATISCASQYIRSRSRGIWISWQKIAKEVDDHKDQITHVNTKNGIITVAIKVDF